MYKLIIFNINLLTSIKNTGQNGEDRYDVVLHESIANNPSLLNLTQLGSDNFNIVTISSLNDVLR